MLLKEISDRFPFQVPKFSCCCTDIRLSFALQGQVTDEVSCAWVRSYVTPRWIAPKGCAIFYFFFTFSMKDCGG